MKGGDKRSIANIVFFGFRLNSFNNKKNRIKLNAPNTKGTAMTNAFGKRLSMYGNPNGEAVNLPPKLKASKRAGCSAILSMKYDSLPGKSFPAFLNNKTIKREKMQPIASRMLAKELVYFCLFAFMLHFIALAIGILQILHIVILPCFFRDEYVINAVIMHEVGGFHKRL